MSAQLLESGHLQNLDASSYVEPPAVSRTFHSLAFANGFSRLFVALVCLTLAASVVWVRSATPLPRAFSHNDYQQPRPLADALEQGFCSVEADIYPVEGKLLVAHDRDRVQSNRDLEVLYLKPLHERVDRNGGRVFPGGPEFVLLIDIKASPEESYRLLRPLLERHAAMLTRFTTSATITGAVTVILSGDRPIERLRSETNRWCALDGRLPDLDANPSPHLFPLVSDSWRPTFAWMENEVLPEADRTRLREFVRRAHEQGRRIRFWGTQDQPYAWTEFKRAGVDLINTDNVTALARFLNPPIAPP
ncbi:MAG: hypothetical protein EXS36_00590 [Pedosphaera sp.]|nr:hypothetical protein [Pedosphaera sp.]